MTLTEKLLPRLNEWKPSGRDTWQAAFDPEGWTVSLTADHNGVVGTLTWELKLTRNEAAPENLSVKTWADTIAARSSGLMERIHVLEVDASRNEAILRSDTPSQKGDVVAYYEIQLFGTETALVRRFQANRKLGTKREQVAFPVTHESLMKLVEDVTA
jgi:hypothetical protein